MRRCSRRCFSSLLPLLLFLLSVGVIGCAPAEQSAVRPALDSGSPQGTFDTEAYLGAWTELWATYDLDKVDELFLADPPPTYFSSEKEGLIVGLDAIREHHAGFGFVPGGSPPDNELWLEDVHSEVFETTAVVTATWYFGDRAIAHAGDRSAVQKGPMTAVFVLDGDRYKIAHMSFAEYRPVMEEESG